MPAKLFPGALAASMFLLFAVAGGSPAATAQDKSPSVPGEIVLRRGVAVGGVSRGGRVPFAEDAVLNRLVRFAWQPPEPGDVVTLPDSSTRSWEALTANEEGWFTGRALTGGYLYAAVESPEERTCLLEAAGDTMVYINGEPRAGDPYSYGYLRLPVRLRRGTNHFLFACSRGRLRARLLPVAAPALWNTDDSTLPDLRAGQPPGPLWAAVPLINTTDRTLSGLKVRAAVAGGKEVETDLPPVPPMTVRKVGFRVEPPATLTSGTAALTLRLDGSDAQIPAAEASVNLRVRGRDETYKETFVSDIDGSVQYFAVNPARKPSPRNALILSLHGASVEAIGQADAYSGKDWATLVAPTNRRPFGFDWEDWGRLDALEVLALARKQFAHDPARTFLTGHSMGGHGTWSLGSLFPDRFAVIGPSAGWISFATYAGGRRAESPADAPPDPVGLLVNRAANQHDTLAWSENLLQERVYILHGDADDNVPVTEARRMRERLAEMKHPRVEWHEEKGAGHWWDDGKTPGAECVDWRPLFARFESERLNRDAWDEVNFTTVNPAVSGENRWARIEQQEKALLPSVIRLTWKPGDGTVTGTTGNVAALTIVRSRLPGGGASEVRSVVLDGQTVEIAPRRRGSDATLRRTAAGKWEYAGGIPFAHKSPARGGPFKQAFQNRFVLVYGTAGTAEENLWSYARARFDAETFLYRGNGSPELIADREYDVRAMGDRSVILYGNADTNRLWDPLLGDGPIRVERGKVRVGGREVAGEDLACLFLRPKPGSATASVGVVAGTGGRGFRLTERLPYFTSGAAFPDWVVADSTVLADARRGVVAAGYFGNDWELTSGESAWRAPEVAPAATGAAGR